MKNTLSESSELPPMSYLVALFGNNQANLVRALSEKGWHVHPQAVSLWIKTPGSVPPKWCRRIEIVSDGAVTREQLRPDIFG